MKAICLLLFLLFATLDVSFACRKKCTIDPRLVRCSAQINYVCAFFKKNPSDKFLSQMDVINACQACIRPGVLAYEQGQCKAKKVYCDALFRPEFCTKEYFPVCAYSWNEDKNKWQGETAGNRCTACADASVDYYVKGACSS